jgi:hypothetical protein
MRFLINERQYRLLNEAIDPFYNPYIPQGWNEPIWKLDSGQSYNALPQKASYYGAQSPIFAKDLLPGWNVYPQQLRHDEYKSHLRVANRDLTTGRVVPKAPFDNQGNFKPSIPAPPNGWWELENKYIKFKEPLGKKDAYVNSKSRPNSLLPPQVNAYYWNSKTGKWVEKNYSNVNEWRDVPAGYHPSEYQLALDWEKNMKKGKTNSGTESTYNKINTIGANPYYSKDYPLGLTRQEYQQNQIDKTQAKANYQKNKKQYDPTAPKIDNTSIRGYQEEAMNKLYLNDINAINNTFGYYKTQQKEDDYDWFGFLLTVASFIPVTAPFARIASIGYDIAKALLLYEQGNHAEAGLNILFAVLPGIKKTVGNLSAEGLIASGGNMRRLLSNNAEQWYTTVSNSLSRQINGVLPVAVQNYGSEQIINNIIKDNLKKYADDHSVKAVLKNGAKYLDQPSES